MPLSQKARAAIDEFGRSPGVTGEHHRNLLDLVDSSPLLAEKFNELVDKQGLRIALTHERHPQGGYSRQYQELYLDPRMLVRTEDRAHYFKRIGTLGYELQRALHDKEQMTKLARIDEKVRRIAKSGGREHSSPRSRIVRIKDKVRRIARPGNHERNYTHAIKKHIDTKRSYQAMAEIGRWNAIVSALHKENGNPEVRPADPNAKHTRWYGHFEVAGNQLPADSKFAGSVVRDDQLFVPMLERNIRAVAHNVAWGDHAVNSAFTNRGHLGGQNRPEPYAVDLVSHIAQCERNRQPTYADGALPKVRIDATALGLTPDVLAEHARNREGNGDGLARMRYLDKSSGTPVCRDFGPSQGTDQDRPLKLSDERHRDHALYRDVLDKVHKLDSTLPAFVQPNLAAALMVEAGKNGIRIDAIHLDGTRLWAVKDAGKPWGSAVAIDIQQAVGTHVEVSSQLWDGLPESQRMKIRPGQALAQANLRPWDDVVRELQQAATHQSPQPSLLQGPATRSL